MDLQPQACFVCRERFMPSYQTLTCAQCQVSLCASCLLLYTPETAFPMHLASCDLGQDVLERYTSHAACANTLFRDPCMATVYYEYQRFYNTDEYINLLEERVANLAQEIQCLNSELNGTHERMASAKYELLAARQRRRARHTSL